MNKTKIIKLIIATLILLVFLNYCTPVFKKSRKVNNIDSKEAMQNSGKNIAFADDYIFYYNPQDHNIYEYNMITHKKRLLKTNSERKSSLLVFDNKLYFNREEESAAKGLAEYDLRTNIFIKMDSYDDAIEAMQFHGGIPPVSRVFPSEKGLIRLYYKDNRIEFINGETILEGRELEQPFMSYPLIYTDEDFLYTYIDRKLFKIDLNTLEKQEISSDFYFKSAYNNGLLFSKKEVTNQEISEQCFYVLSELGPTNFYKDNSTIPLFSVENESIFEIITTDDFYFVAYEKNKETPLQVDQFDRDGNFIQTLITITDKELIFKYLYVYRGELYIEFHQPRLDNQGYQNGYKAEKIDSLNNNRIEHIVGGLYKININ